MGVSRIDFYCSYDNMVHLEKIRSEKNLKGYSKIISDILEAHWNRGFVETNFRRVIKDLDDKVLQLENENRYLKRMAGENYVEVSKDGLRDSNNSK